MKSFLFASIAVQLLVSGLALTGCGEGGAAGSATEDRAGAPAPSRPTEVESASHAAMLDLLGGIAAKKSEHPYLGDAQVAALEARLAATHEAPARFQVLQQLATLEVRAGRIDSGIEHFDEADGLYRTLAARLPKARRFSFLFNVALAHLRRAETQNCVECRGTEGCLLPITEKGIHQKPEASRRAIAYLKEALEIERGNPACVWLLNIAAMTVGEYPDGVPEAWRIPRSAFAAGVPFPRFPNVSGELGLDTVNLSGGAVIDDIDGDGRLDVLTSTWDIAESPQLFLSRSDGTFREVSKEWGLDGLHGGLNMVHADYDNDGDVDVLILRGAWLGSQGRHPNSLLRNMGDRFVDVTFAAGLGEAHHPTQTAAWADYDLDGHLDLYVGNESNAQHPCASQLFRNNGDGTFTDVAMRAGVTNDRFTKGVSWGDHDDDGDPDLYVSNMGDRNRLYRNEGDGRFVDVAPALGVEGPRMSFPTWFWDYDNDGTLDLFVASYVSSLTPVVASHALGRDIAEVAALYRGDGRGGFEEVGRASGLRRLDTTMGANFGDLDNDGYPDFYLGTGYPGLEGLVPNAMYWNRSGRTFQDVSVAGGFSHLQKGHAVVFADLDADGDQDVFEQLGGAYPVDGFANALFENPGFDNHWLIVQLVGTTCNRSAIGAHVIAEIIEGGVRREVHTRVNAGGSFGSSPLRRHIGLGTASRLERLTIRWPGSKTSRVIEGVEADQFIRVVQGKPGFERLTYDPSPRDH